MRHSRRRYYRIPIITALLRQRAGYKCGEQHRRDTARRGSTMKPVMFPDEAERDIEFPSLNNALLTVRRPSRQRLVRLIANMRKSMKLALSRDEDRKPTGVSGCDLQRPDGRQVRLYEWVNPS